MGKMCKVFGICCPLNKIPYMELTNEDKRTTATIVNEENKIIIVDKNVN